MPIALFKEGDRWRRRDRGIMTIYRVLPEGVDHPVVALTPERTIIRYDVDGYLESKELPHDHDLIAPTRMAE